MSLAWILNMILAAAVVLLAVKIGLLQKSADEICREFTARLEGDTNNPIFVSSRDRHLCRLASEINAQLGKLRRERQRFQTGNRKLTEAVANISHDLRTPLTAISGYLDLLEGERQSDTVTRYLDCIRNRTEMLTQLTQELFTYTLVAGGEEAAPRASGQKGSRRAAAGKRERLELNRLLEECLISYYGAFQRQGIEPEILLPQKPVYISGQKASLARIFGNIISNALKYSDGDFAVTLTKEAVITFSNRAEGLTPVLAEQLFQRYYTVETGGQSTGLGLAIARELVEGLGGRIHGECREGRLVITVELGGRDNTAFACDTGRCE